MANYTHKATTTGSIQVETLAEYIIMPVESSRRPCHKSSPLPEYNPLQLALTWSSVI